MSESKAIRALTFSGEGIQRSGRSRAPEASIRSSFSVLPCLRLGAREIIQCAHWTWIASPTAATGKKAEGPSWPVNDPCEVQRV